jgi:RHS repeat-associated protein
VQATLRYRPFGAEVGGPAPGLDRLRYTGREFDPESGLYYYRARYYDPTLGRFLAEDPLGLDGGDLNLHGYVGNNPLRFNDPNGLTAFGLGVELSAGAGAGGSFSVHGVADSSGNVGIAFSENVGGHGGVTAGTAPSILFYPTAETIFDMRGIAANVGFATPLFGANAIIGEGPNSITGYSFQFGSDAIGPTFIEQHGYIGNTQVIAVPTFIELLPTQTDIQACCSFSFFSPFVANYAVGNQSMPSATVLYPSRPNISGALAAYQKP